MLDIEYLRGRGQEIESHLEENFDSAEFLPCTKIDQFLGRNAVELALKASGLNDREDLVNFVLQPARAKRIFLILLYMSEEREKLSFLANFLKQKLTDASLPVKKSQLGSIFTSNNDRTLFCKYQHMVTSPEFGKDKFRSKLHTDTILPYLKSHNPSGRGFFGEVSRMDIHPSHIPEDVRLTLGGTASIAVKTANNHDQIAKFFEQEATALERLKNHNSPNLVQPIAAYEYKNQKCLVFPWAHGGDLYKFWEAYQEKTVDLEWIISQFTGLCSVLNDLHKINCRHGDLKPDNILWYRDKDGLGTLKIADLGLAAFHIKDTGNRRGIQTMTPTGTARYEPPETAENKTGERSRMYDIWSMGCIMLELLIWLTQGIYAVDKLGTVTDYFWKRDDKSHRYEIHPEVRKSIEELYKHEAVQGNQTYSDLLTLVTNGLLVVSLQSDANQGAHRYEASKLYEQMLVIDNNYQGNGSVQPSQARSMTGRHRQERHSQNQASQLYDVWQSTSHNQFAAQFLSLVGWDNVRPDSNLALNNLCARCSSIKTTPLFSSTLPVEIQANCDLCSMLSIALDKQGIAWLEGVRIQQKDGAIGVLDAPYLLSVYSEPGQSVPHGARLGLPQLPDQGGTGQFLLLKEWARVCSLEHEKCRSGKDQIVKAMPTRLISVQEPVHLLDSSSIDPTDYIALSHCWGKLTEDQKFCTYKRNITQLRTKIDTDRLPKTFRDAIVVTRGMGIQYLWIDSLCIIQDDDIDWEQEAGKMEQVFSGAYCTISATAAKSSLDGFLSDRSPRPYVHLDTKDGRLWICPAIDDFRQDVDAAEISTRGWVLQERLLSRRTIHFTSNQVYWECGEGVCCETLGHLENPRAALTSDANFPSSVLKLYRDGRQMLIQDLHERYTRLNLTVSTDRSVAILGLETRLARALETQTAYGLFDTYFARGLLWKRGQESSMPIIPYQEDKRVPSWSWFHRKGVIEYMDLKYDRVDWMSGNFNNPFTTQQHGGSRQQATSEAPKCSHVLKAKAKSIKTDGTSLSEHIVFDDEKFDLDKVKCVTIGSDKIGGGRIHVLLITVFGAPEENKYKRVGVMSLRPTSVDGEGLWVDIY
ncbi:related to tol protein [Fusarium fujikuroi IMI 58289]|uniref:Related to tol protein n=1 Tax=Gibberella fujikuroi (strain CBS 195.34 / IMI 58289 / NRRL A-6831) TaxID=1279085 RepID=S0E2Z7_GIBF5|nr:related to tol protein [Fusarium fujikuroi IMI 58289]KLP00877.1 tol protein [Fusarium fujikuroi]CCT69239.1 related to tol protein [Fusarium fujikuroi IMI 58289]SCN87442.1 related to tol protein [Fusarium fujikuroi]SCN93964.1 related to tol protein [Fusarium fujikuroi]SCO31056.1 related to tol protein [Fusarium fujikuroi]